MHPLRTSRGGFQLMYSFQIPANVRGTNSAWKHFNSPQKVIIHEPVTWMNCLSISPPKHSLYRSVVFWMLKKDKVSYPELGMPHKDIQCYKMRQFPSCMCESWLFWSALLGWCCRSTEGSVEQLWQLWEHLARWTFLHICCISKSYVSVSWSKGAALIKLSYI